MLVASNVVLVSLDYVRYLALVFLLTFGVATSYWLSKVLLSRHPWAKHKRDCEEFCHIKLLLESWRGDNYRTCTKEGLREVLDYIEAKGFARVSNIENPDEVYDIVDSFYRENEICYPVSENVPVFLDNRSKTFRTFVSMYQDYRISHTVVFCLFLFLWVFAIIPYFLYLSQ